MAFKSHFVLLVPVPLGLLTLGCGCVTRRALTCDQAFFFFFFFFSRADEARGKKKERHKGIIGRGHDLRLDALCFTDMIMNDPEEGKISTIFLTEFALSKKVTVSVA